MNPYPNPHPAPNSCQNGIFNVILTQTQPLPYPEPGHEIQYAKPQSLKSNPWSRTPELNLYLNPKHWTLIQNLTLEQKCTWTLNYTRAWSCQHKLEPWMDPYTNHTPCPLSLTIDSHHDLSTWSLRNQKQQPCPLQPPVTYAERLQENCWFVPRISI